MGVPIHLSEDQRRTAIALFEVGLGKDAAATRMGVTASATGRLFERWQVRGAGALVAKTTKRSFSFEFKLAVVRRYLAGEKAVDLAREFDLSSPGQVATWARGFRREGEDALRPKPKGRRPLDPDAPPREPTEVELLRRENERLRAQVAYLGKLRALREQQRR
jgi:transposase